MSVLLDIAPVLLVDDEPAERTMLMIALTRAGIPVLEAASGEECLRVLQEQQVSVVVCDLGMTGMSGLDVVRALRASPQTATLPFILLTGSGDANTVIEALEAGADDFLAKPTRLDELVARVRAHIRTGSAWSVIVEQELHARASAVAALGRLTVPTDPEGAAEAVVGELASRTGSPFVSVLQVSVRGGLQPLATFTPEAGVIRGGGAMSRSRGNEVLAKARIGAWVERRPEESSTETANPFWAASVDVVAGAPIYAGEALVGALILGAQGVSGPATRDREARLLAGAVDFASVLGATAGSAIAERRRVVTEQTRLRRILTAKQFHSVYQPIVELKTRRLIGNEALTRFDDGTPPDLRFAEAAEIGLGAEYELAAMEAAIASAGRLAVDTILTINLSPAVVVGKRLQLARLLKRSERAVVFEVTEHEPIGDYAAFLSVIRELGDVPIAVDDAGAGYASLRHLLELRPAFAKLDISLVRQIDRDPLRQALAAGLVFYAAQGECHLIAEGVETEEEAQTLLELNVEYAQGYLFGRPEPIS